MNFKEKQYVLNALEIVDEQKLSALAKTSLEMIIQLREKGIPLAKILQKKPFMNDDFVTTSDTLDPRPETEFLIEKVEGKIRNILELGTGTGCLVLSLLKKFPKAKAIAVDVCQKAIEIAKLNAQILELEKRVVFVQNNWAFGLEKKIQIEKFDLVICNPPYVASNADLSLETLHDPAIALFGNENTYHEIIDSLQNIQFEQLIFEIPETILASVENLLKEKGFEVSSQEIYDSKIFILKAEKKTDTHSKV